MFNVTSLNLRNVPRTADGNIDWQQDFFSRPAYLTVSGQLEGEIFALAFSKVYTFGPTFRAENSNTPRHLAEFWMIEPEMAFTNSNNMKLAEEVSQIHHSYVLDQCHEIWNFSMSASKDGPEHFRTRRGSTFGHISYTDAIGS
jgi:asparaginyl-tRNA synthetase